MAHGRVVVEPEVVAVVVGPKGSGQLGGVSGNDLKRLLRMDAAVEIVRTHAGSVHPEERGVLGEQLAREQLAHGMQLVLHRDAPLAARIGEDAAFVGGEEREDLGGRDVGADGVEAAAGRQRGPVHFGQLLGGQDDSPHLPPSVPFRGTLAGERKKRAKHDERETQLHQKRRVSRKTSAMAARPMTSVMSVWVR